MARSMLERFEEKIEPVPECGCWIWTAAEPNKRGYGSFGVGAGRAMLAHRASYQIYKGPIPKGMSVLHVCDTPSCVNPHHLFLGTQKDNVLDAACKGRHKTHITRGTGNAMSRLSELDVMRIRNDARVQRIIAKDYGVSQSIISDIKTGKAWRHI